jgi:Flp pilus assembly protein TadG
MTRDSTAIKIAKSCWRDNEGSALVEGAVLMPILFALMFGIFEFSWFFYQQHMISAGLRDAARYLTRSSSACEPASRTWNVEETIAKNLATTGSANGSIPRVRGWRAGMVTIRCTAIDNSTATDGLRNYRGGDIIYIVTVSTRFSEPSLGFFRLLGLRSPVISLSHSQRVIGPG